MQCYECGTFYDLGSCPHCSQRKVLERTEKIEAERLEIAKQQHDLAREHARQAEWAERNRQMAEIGQRADEARRKIIDDYLREAEQNAAALATRYFAEIVVVIHTTTAETIHGTVLGLYGKFVEATPMAALGSEGAIAKAILNKFSDYIINHPDKIASTVVAKLAFEKMVGTIDATLEERRKTEASEKAEKARLEKAAYEQKILTNLQRHQKQTPQPMQCLECGYVGKMGHVGHKGIVFRKMIMECPNCEKTLNEQ